MTLRLPKELRIELKKPFGNLYKGRELECIRSIKHDFRNPTKMISVGDLATFYLIKSGTIPDIGVVDGMIMRKPAPEEVVRGTMVAEFRNISIDNPAGRITEELIFALRESLENDKPTRIFVNGEEDLATLPAVILSPISSVVIYGQPDMGVVAVSVTDTKKEEARTLLRRMEGNTWKSRL
ncbi:MAG: DUF359 domain-containing protein [Methanocellales archaeon]|nr:DUF359 domain-containing protein [Methanocellales archaeon]